MLAVAGGTATHALAQFTVSTAANGGHTVQMIDPNAEFTFENHVETSVPSALNGIDVGTLLGADRFYNNGTTGQNASVANVEAGHLWSGHETMGHAVTTVTGTGATGDVDRHATWVSMMIGGRNGGTTIGDHQTGLAPGADLQSGAIATKWNGNAFSLSFSISTTSFLTAYDGFFGSANVINSSWGGTDAAGTAFFGRAIGGFAYMNPGTTMVASAGNSGSGANTVGTPGSGTNLITVGALENVSNVYDTVASFSSRGPQTYSDPNQTLAGVRAPVDIAAPGTDLVSAYYGGQTGGNDAALTNSPSGIAGTSSTYTSPLAGTSFAAPITAGVATLLNSHSLTNGMASESRDARVVKAVLMNAADKTVGWDNGQADVSGVVTTTQSLDYAVGAGALNAGSTFDQYTAGTTDVAGTGGGTVDVIGWDLGSLAVTSSNDYVINTALQAGDTLTATLDWFRNQSVNVAGGTATDSAFANMDLSIWDSGFTTKVAESISLYNETEHLHLSLPNDGLYGLRVSFIGHAFNLIGAAANTESFGLAWSVQSVPEPASALLLVLGGVLSARRGRRPAG